MGATIKVFCATIKAVILCIHQGRVILCNHHLPVFMSFFSMPWHFFLSIRVSQLTIFFITFYSFYPAKRFFLFSFFSSIAPSHYPFLRNCYHHPPNEDDVCTNAWQQDVFLNDSILCHVNSHPFMYGIRKRKSSVVNPFH